MTTSEVVTNCFIELFDINPSINARLIDLSLDSLDVLSLTQLLEQRLIIAIPDLAIKTINRVSDIVRLVDECRR